MTVLVAGMTRNLVIQTFVRIARPLRDQFSELFRNGSLRLLKQMSLSCGGPAPLECLLGCLLLRELDDSRAKSLFVLIVVVF